MTRALILLTNDDGVESPALQILADVLEDLGEVWVFAPDREQSGVGHGVSLHRPLRVNEVRERWYAIDGTPTDCVLLATRQFLDRKPDLLLSGINSGPNLGDDITYSGTVAGAYEGMLLGIPSIALSNASYDPTDYQTAARCGLLIARHVLENGLPKDTVLNVNVPNVPYEQLKGIAITHQGLREFEGDIIQREDPRGKSYYWIGGYRPKGVIQPGTDIEATEQNRVSVTPLHRNLTNLDALEALKARNIQL